MPSRSFAALALVARSWLLVLCSVAAGAQSNQHSPKPFAGCYEIDSLAWNPPDAKNGFIPKKFELSIESSGNQFAMHGLPSDDPFRDKLSSWKPKTESKIWVNWSSGYGGFSGTLRKTGNELNGKLKESCDFRCEWKKRTGTLQAHRIDCDAR